MAVDTRPPSSTCAPSPVPTRNPADASKISLAFGVPPPGVTCCHYQSRRSANGNLWSSGRQDDFAEILTVPPARLGRRVGAVSVHCTPRCWLASARIVLSPAGPAGGSSPVRRRCSGGGRGRFPARRRWRVLPWRAGRRMRRRGHLQMDASPGRQEQQGQRLVGPYRRCYGLSPSRRACGGAL